MGRCNQRTLGRRPGCEHDLASDVEATQRVLADIGGKVFFVDPNHPKASDAYAGTDPDFPLATVAQAVSLCRAYRGDVIVVMHNGYWTYGDMGQANVTPVQESVTVDVPGVRIVGTSAGPLGVPWIATADDTACITVTQLDVTIEGFCFWDYTGYSNSVGIVATWDAPPYGESLTVRDCYFYDFDDYGISLDYTYNCRIENCRFDDIGTAAIYNPGAFGDPDYLVIRNCVFVSNVADIDLADTNYALIEGCRFMGISTAITLDGGYYNQIINNVIQGNGAGANNMINLTGGGDNVVTGNTLSCTIAQYDTTCSDATSGAWGGNHCSNGDTTAAPT